MSSKSHHQAFLREQEARAAGDILWDNLDDAMSLIQRYREENGLEKTLSIGLTPISCPGRSIRYGIIPEVHEIYYIQMVDDFPLGGIFGRFLDFHRIFLPADKYGTITLLKTDIQVGGLDPNMFNLPAVSLRIRHDYGQRVDNVLRKGDSIPSNEQTIKTANNMIESILGKELSQSFRRHGKHHKYNLENHFNKRRK